MKLALFDFDGTITTHDSFREFLIFIYGRVGFMRRILPVTPFLVGFMVGLVSREDAKKKVCHAFFKKMPEAVFKQYAQRFVGEQLPKMIRPAAIKKIQWHRENAHRIILVSASFSNYLQFWCDSQNIELISTNLQIVDGKLSGNFASPNCWGPEKERRIQELVDLKDYKTIYAYGDSRGDREMLAMAHEPNFRPFRENLR